MKSAAATTTAHKIGLGLIAVAACAPGFFLSGWVPEAHALLGLRGWIAFAVVGGILGGVLFTRGKGPSWIGAVSGPIASLGSLALTWALFAHASTVSQWQFVLVLFLGMVPGGIVHWRLLERAQG